MPPISRVRAGAFALGLTLAVSLLAPTTLAAAPQAAARVADEAVPATPAAPARRAPEHPGALTNPLANRHWAVYKGPAELSWAPYYRARGNRRKALSHIALQPKATWFGRFVPNRSIGKVMHRYIEDNLRGNPKDSLVQMTIFRVDPWEYDACRRLPTKDQQASYKDYIDRVARQIGSTHVALVLQPDGPFALCAPRHSKVYSHLVAYAARTFSRLPHTAVYIDAGAADWFRDNAAMALRLLLPAGIKGARVRGLALNSTHYSGTDREVAFCAKVVRALARRGIADKHCVVGTAQNGRPFAGYTYDGPNFNLARVCKKRTQRRCVTLGIPPTTDVGNPQWGLAPVTNVLAERYVDAYLWFQRPWLGYNSLAFDLKRALNVVKTRRYYTLS